jgi:hypothetical protein
LAVSGPEPLFRPVRVEAAGVLAAARAETRYFHGVITAPAT